MVGVFSDYEVAGNFDEVFEAPGVPRRHYRAIVEALQSFGPDDLADRQRRANLAFLHLGITFTVYSETAGTERIFPFDLVPRAIDSGEWCVLERGLKQRVVALNMFLQDVYNDARIIDAGLVPSELVYASPNYMPCMRGMTPPGGVWAHVSGIDLVRDANGTMYVLEDNVRTPSGVSYVMQNRQISTRTLPRLLSASGVASIADYTGKLRSAIQAGAGDLPPAMLTPGPYNSAYFEHTFLARQMGVQLVEGRDLIVSDGRVAMKTTRGLEPLGAIYRRVDDLYLDPLNFAPDSTLGVPGLLDVYRMGDVSLANAIGTGVADDKAVYPYVPEMIRFYLGEEPIIENVPTYHGSNERHREYILANLRDLVVKPTNASGGYGVVIGPMSSDRVLEETATSIQADPRNFIAQPLIRLSTCPTVIDGEFRPRRIDLRPFVVYDGKEPWVLPGGLTRVALQEDSFIVNSSQGGGSKDTWVVHAS